MATAADVEKTLRALIGRFSAADDGAKASLPNRRTILCVIPDVDRMFRAEYADGKISKFRKIDEREPADVVVTVAADDLMALSEGRLNIGSALLMRRLRVDASIQDMLLLRALFR